ncbi:MAG: hypothetical protein IPP13_22120 [Kouleothrix sp.]|jgi:hypothetical protein|nr:hypothetical protein [Kouleothrix sp.]
MSEIAFTYSKEDNPGETFIPGVPLRDLTVAEVQAMPKHMRDGVRKLSFYVATGALPADIFETAPDATLDASGAQESAGQPSETAGATPAAVTSARRARPTPSETKGDDSNP